MSSGQWAGVMGTSSRGRATSLAVSLDGGGILLAGGARLSGRGGGQGRCLLNAFVPLDMFRWSRGYGLPYRWPCAMSSCSLSLVTDYELLLTPES